VRLRPGRTAGPPRAVGVRGGGSGRIDSGRIDGVCLIILVVVVVIVISISVSSSISVSVNASASISNLLCVLLWLRGPLHGGRFHGGPDPTPARTFVLPPSVTAPF
jgi:hypothetical protein